MSQDNNSYFEYKKNKMQKMPERENPSGSRFSLLFKLFLVTFIVMFIAIAIAIMKYSSKMDIEYVKGDLTFHNADNMNKISTYDASDEIQRKIDKRLVLIQQEENMPYPSKIVGEEMTQPKAEKQVIEEDEPKEIVETKPKAEVKKEVVHEVAAPKKVSAPLPQAAPKQVKKAPDYEPLDTTTEVFSKVLVGRFQTLPEAQKMQAAIRAQDATLNPFVKRIGEYYTLQLGSYSDFSVAKARAQALKAKGFDVWIYQQ